MASFSTLITVEYSLALVSDKVIVNSLHASVSNNGYQGLKTFAMPVQLHANLSLLILAVIVNFTCCAMI